MKREKEEIENWIKHRADQLMIFHKDDIGYDYDMAKNSANRTMGIDMRQAKEDLPWSTSDIHIKDSDYFQNIIKNELSDTKKHMIDNCKSSIELLIDSGFNPIRYTVLYFEDTFVFETTEEAHRAYEKFEAGKHRKIIGWWYSLADFKTTIDDYIKEIKGFPIIINIDEIIKK